MFEYCKVKLQPERGYTRLTPECGAPAKGQLPDGTPACGRHLRSKAALVEHAEEDPVIRDAYEDATWD